MHGYFACEIVVLRCKSASIRSQASALFCMLARALLQVFCLPERGGNGRAA